MNRDERLDRQAHDDGGMDDTVWYCPSYSERGDGKPLPTAQQSPGGEVYHADTDCPRLSKARVDPRETTREAAQRRWLAPCMACVLDSIQYDHNSASGRRAKYEPDHDQ